MRTIKISVTDKDGMLLALEILNVNDDINTIAFRPVAISQSPRADESELEIGLGISED